MKQEFQWSDETVREFIAWGRRHLCFSDIDVMGMDINKFKESKQPKPGWEILEGKVLGDLPHQWMPLACPSMGCHIWSVKRLSDGEVFAVGDLVHYLHMGKEKYYLHIRSFELWNDGDLVVHELDRPYMRGTAICSINSLVKERYVSPLFTTQDGKEIFDGDDCWYVYSLMMSPMKWKAKSPVNKTGNFFSTEEAANKWIVLNKPCLSLLEIMETTGAINGLPGAWTKLRELVKNKMGITAIVFLSIGLLLVGCKGKHAAAPVTILKPLNHTPHSVVNACTGMWAVQTNEQYRDNVFGRKDPKEGIDRCYFGQYMGYRMVIDSSGVAPLGSEYQFKDSITAITVYNSFRRRYDKAFQDALEAERKKDSIFTCQHTYK